MKNRPWQRPQIANRWSSRRPRRTTISCPHRADYARVSPRLRARATRKVESHELPAFCFLSSVPAPSPARPATPKFLAISGSRFYGFKRPATRRHVSGDRGVAGGLLTARERLLRYCARPPLALERLSVLDDGRICYRIKDTEQVRLMTPMQFMARRTALVPPPRHPLVPAGRQRLWRSKAPQRPFAGTSEAQAIQHSDRASAARALPEALKGFAGPWSGQALSDQIRVRPVPRATVVTGGLLSAECSSTFGRQKGYHSRHDECRPI